MPIAPRSRLPKGHWLLQVGGLSVLVHRRGSLISLALLLLLAGMALTALSLGAGKMGVYDAWQTLLGHGNRLQQVMLFDIRLPRVLAVIVAGAALGLSGCLVQTLVQNRLATPDMIGVNEGATVAIVVFSLHLTFGSWPWWAAPLGALFAAACLFTLCRHPGEQGYLFIVVGIGLTELFNALSEFAMSSQPIAHLGPLYLWTMGHFGGQGYQVVVPVSLCLALLMPCVLLLQRSLSGLRLGTASAQALGVPVTAVQLAVLGVAIIMAGLGAAIGGPVIFIAMAAPVLASRLMGFGPVPIWLAALLGALLLLLADTLVRALADPVEVPAGLMTRVLGGILLLLLLLQNRERLD